MKLTRKMTTAVLVMMTIALGFCSIATILFCRYALLTDVANYTAHELGNLESAMNSKANQINNASSELVKKSGLRYYIAHEEVYASAGSVYVLQSEDEDIYNNSGIDVRQVLNADRAKIYGADGTDGAGETDDETAYEVARTKYDLLHMNDHYYCVMGIETSIISKTVVIAVVADITSNMQMIHVMTAGCLLVWLFVTVITAIILMTIMRRGLSPIMELTDRTRQIAAGDYSSRIELKRQDELGTLAENFNQMADAVQNHVAEVEASAQKQQMLLSALSHEMRTPVTAITGYAYALRHMKMSAAQQEEAIAFVDEESRRLERLVTKLTKLIGVSHEKLELEAIDMVSWMGTLENILRAKTGGQPIEVACVCAKHSVYADADLLTELATNLVDNAVKAGATEILVTFENETLSVCDNGCGMAEGELAKIMAPFYQLDRSRNREGFGLGLALCQQIAALHGSQLSVKSKLGEGSTFSLKLYSSFTTP